MGIVQGLSEFLPISSSAHLVFTSNFYKVFSGAEVVEHSSQEVFFDIMLHLGTLIAVLIFFRKDLVAILKAMFVALQKRDFSDLNARVGFFILFGTVITVIVSLPLQNWAYQLVYLPEVVGILLIITGFVLFLSEYLSKKHPQKTQVDFKVAFWM